MRKIRIALLGLGVIGSHFYEQVQNSREYSQTEEQISYCISRIFVRNLHKKRNIDLEPGLLTDNAYEAMEHADLVVECIGGSNPELTKEYLLWAMVHKKHIIMSSKKCLAIYGKELMQTAKENQIQFRYEATVGGCIPILHNLHTFGKYEKITKISGICNGTSNYILTDVFRNNRTIEEAILAAKEQGITENDPTEDIAGFDALYKSVIMCYEAFHQWIPLSGIEYHSNYKSKRFVIKRETLKDISPAMLQKAKEDKKVVKQIFELSNSNNQLSCVITNKLLSQDDLLSMINDTNNIFVVSTNVSKDRGYYGKGAGGAETASIMFDELVNLGISSNVDTPLFL